MTQYVGRLVGLGLTNSGKPLIFYRVASRSFPNRQIGHSEQGAFVLPTPGFEADTQHNTFILYRAYGLHGMQAVVSNGSHTDLLLSRLNAGHHPKDALSFVLSVMGVEGDGQETPRIAAIVDISSGLGFLGVVTSKTLHIETIQLAEKKFHIAATQHLTKPTGLFLADGLIFDSADSLAKQVLSGDGFSQFSNPVCALAAVWTDGHWLPSIANE